MTACTRSGLGFFVAALAILAVFGIADAQTINKCQAGKKKCVIKKVTCLVNCHAKAETKGAVLDASCELKCRQKFDGNQLVPPDPTKGCIQKLQAKGGCLTPDETAAMEAKVDAFVLDVVAELDPGYPVPVENKCSAGKKRCVAKKAKCLLGCHVKAETKGVLDPNCLLKCRQKFDGSLLVPPAPAKGCFEKLEAMGNCLTLDDTVALENKIDAFVDDVVCELDQSTGTCPLPTPTPTITPTPTPTVTAPAVVIAPGDDHWMSHPPLPPAGSSADFSGSPIPGGFFDPGSDPFTGIMDLCGAPLTTIPLGALGSTDTIVRRPAPTLPLPLGGQDTVPIEIVALSLVSCQPITVTYNGGMSPEPWNVSVTLSPTVPAPPGSSMTITKSHANGGTFDSSLHVQPMFIFARVSDSAARTIDPGPQVQLSSTGSSWVIPSPTGCDPGTLGIDPCPPGVQVDGKGLDGVFDYVTAGESNFRAGLDPGTCDCAPNQENAMLAAHGVIVPGDSDGDGWSDVCDNCPSTPNPDQADGDSNGIGDACEPPISVPAGDDAWQTPPPGPGGIRTFTDFSSMPIPPGFFGPGSDPFTGVIEYRGAPLATVPIGALGDIDTIVRRPAPTALLPVGGQDTVPIEIVALNLVSVMPITVTYGGGMSPEPWNVAVTLSHGAPQLAGSMTIKRTVTQGGVFDSQLPVVPRFVFTRVGPPGQQILDPAPQVQLQGMGSSWLIPRPTCDPLVLGVDPCPPGVQVDGKVGGPFDYVTAGDSPNFRVGIRPIPCNCGFSEESAMLAAHDVETPGDVDADGWSNICDNCPNIANSSQADLDLDFVGDVCDNCPSVFNPAQADNDMDGIGDACDPTP